MVTRQFFAELKRRHVYRVVIGYPMVAWLVLQVCGFIFPLLEFETWVLKFVLVLVLRGYPVALILAWAFDITPEGFKRTGDAFPDEAIRRQTGRKIFGVITLLAALVLGLFLFQLTRHRSGATKAASPNIRREG